MPKSHQSSEEKIYLWVVARMVLFRSVLPQATTKNMKKMYQIQAAMENFNSCSLKIVHYMHPWRNLVSARFGMHPEFLLALAYFDSFFLD
jgi:hypothetical protein